MKHFRQTIDRVALAIVAVAAMSVAVLLHVIGADWPRMLGGVVFVVTVCLCSVLARPFVLALIMGAEVRRQGRDIDRRLDALERQYLRRSSCRPPDGG